MNEKLPRSQLAVVALNIVPPIIRDCLLEDSEFAAKYSLNTKPVVCLGETEYHMLQCDIYDAARQAMTSRKAIEVSALNGVKFSLTCSRQQGGNLKFVLSQQNTRLILPDLGILSDSKEARIRSFKEAAGKSKLPKSDQAKWRAKLDDGPLSYSEVESYHLDLRNTPTYVEGALGRRLSGGECGILDFVPQSRQYFERLVGAYDGSSNIESFIESTTKPHMLELLQWRDYDALLLCLSLCSHASVSSGIPLQEIDEDTLKKALHLLATGSEPLSRIGIFELGVRALSSYEDIEPHLLDILQEMRYEKEGSESDEFTLFSSLFILVDGELSRVRVLADCPPFYRRMAALAQAALIHRQIILNKVPYESISEWALSIRSEQFYMQSLSDMRREPRWNPDFFDAEKLRAQFLGRALMSVNSCSSQIQRGELWRAVLGDDENSLVKCAKFPDSYLPGPLDGEADNAAYAPNEVSQAIEEQLSHDDIDAFSFTALVNSALIFKTKISHAELATRALAYANYTILRLNGRHHLMGILNGLATVAAISRSPALAEKVRILTRRYRQDHEYGLTIDESIRVCLVASAAHEDFDQWRELSGSWLTELSFGELEHVEVKAFKSHLLALLHSVPGLWHSCSKAHAALSARCSQ